MSIFAKSKCYISSTVASFGSQVIWLIVGLQAKTVTPGDAYNLRAFRSAMLQCKPVTTKLSNSGIVNIRNIVV